MARRDDHYRHHRHQQERLHYASILPVTTNDIDYNDPRVVRRSHEQERKKALYIDFEDAFQDQTTNHDYFGFQSPEYVQQNPHQSANFHLQSVQTISELENRNFSPHIRYQASRETTSHSSTPSDTPPYQPRYIRRPDPPRLPPSSHHNHLSTSNSRENLNRESINFNIIQPNDNKEIPGPFNPDFIRLKSPNPSAQIKLLLPQYFLVKYLGRTPCPQLWGSKAVRTPIDDMVRAARQLSSMNEIPTLEACVNTSGFTLTHRHSPVQNKHHQSRKHSPERYQHGLIPLENISYVMHDIKYSKIAACIVLRQLKTSSTDNKTTNETLTECYAFLFQSKEHAHRFALALSEAFNTQIQPIKPSREEGRSPQRRSRHRSSHHHDRTRHNDNYLRDSEV